ncbi:hypothetical protein C8J57DRAFT_1238175 [Mycena rebaudengoi]|nr:hypothetical protein C8J57DRAFT_1238175 [Mycena rebaudengoi]
MEGSGLREGCVLIGRVVIRLLSALSDFNIDPQAPDNTVRLVQGYTAGPEDIGAADMGGADMGGSAVADVRVAAGEGGKEGSAIVVRRGGWWYNAGGATGRQTRRGRSRKGHVGLWTLLDGPIVLCILFFGWGGPSVYFWGQHSSKLFVGWGAANTKSMGRTIRVVICLEIYKMQTEHNTIPRGRSIQDTGQTVTGWPFSGTSGCNLVGPDHKLKVQVYGRRVPPPMQIPRYPPVNRKLSYVVPLQNACKTTSQRVQLPKKVHSRRLNQSRGLRKEYNGTQHWTT